MMSGYLEVMLYLFPVFVLGVFIFLLINENRWQKKIIAFDKIIDPISPVQLSGNERTGTGKTHSPTPTSLEQTVSWRHPRIQKFYQKHVLPCEKILSVSGYLSPVNSLLSLLDTHGDCPSVIQREQDHEYQAVANVYDLLAKITLMDHSLNVAEQMIAFVLKAKTRDPEMIMGKILVAALGHDIGKIPGLMDGQPSRKGDHPYISYLVLKNVILTDVSPQHEEILTAVKSHHFPVQEGFTHELRKADQAAREMESEMLSMKEESGSELMRIMQEQLFYEVRNIAPGENEKKKGKIPDLLDLSWLDLDEFFQRIEPEINRVETSGYFRAFSMNNGLVYLMLSLVSETVIHLAKQTNHLEILVDADSKTKKRSIEYTIKTMLAEKGLIPSFIGKGFSGARFALIDADGRKKKVGIYMPIEARAFSKSLADLDNKKNKASVINEIKEVRPLVGQKKMISAL
ncbi:MAG: hypothetical protein AVO38_03575 [delta proteobacterium ML8_D]|nr:MAG: hypothetical protein AVO38_03575 [delta proteobacterium ML8_D]